MTVIETFDLTKHYRSIPSNPRHFALTRKVTNKAVDHISFQVEQGQIFGFLGPNGSGKTTTIGMLLGILTPTSGGIRLFGEYERGRLHVARKRIGATLETPNFYPYLSGIDNLRIAARIKGVDETAVGYGLELVGLAKRAKDKFSTYSLGMKQRLAIAATLLSDPELVILDEPANGLDPEGIREIRDLIHRLADEGKTVFLSSHLLWEVERTCTHVAIIKRGRILQQSSVSELVDRGTILELENDDPQELADHVREFTGASAVRVDDRRVTAHLATGEAADLNRFLATRGVFVSHLARKQMALEDVFMEMTGRSPRGEVGGATDEDAAVRESREGTEDREPEDGSSSSEVHESGGEIAGGGAPGGDASERETRS